MSQRVLVLGGTAWLGGAVARAATSAGHQVTCLARGESGAAPAGTRFVSADRWGAAAYAEVGEEDWDLVVDLSWQPDLVRAALSALSGRARHWVLVSSVSAYAEEPGDPLDESAPLLAPWAGSGPATIEDYGPAKVAAERACADALPPDRLTIIRPGLIGGYGDPSDRLGYWPARMALVAPGREEVLVPAELDRPFQVVDVLDLADWVLACGLAMVAGQFDAVGDVVPLRAVLDLSAAAAGTSPTLVAAGDDWLTEQEVSPWAGPESLALWVPGQEAEAFMGRANTRATAAGLVLRPLAETIARSLAWERELGLLRPRRAGLSASREAALIARLRSA